MDRKNTPFLRVNTLIILGAFLLFFTAVVFVRETKIGQKSTPTPTSAPLPQYLFNADEYTANSLKVEKAGGDVVLIGRDPSGGWAVINPITPTLTVTDTANVTSVMGQLGYITSLTTITEPVSLDLFGLATPAYTITLSLVTGEQYVVRVGVSTPTGSGYYVQLNGGFPQVVAKYGLDPILTVFDKLPLPVTPTPTFPVTGTVTSTLTITTGLPTSTVVFVTPTATSEPPATPIPTLPSPTAILTPQPSATIKP